MTEIFIIVIALIILFILSERISKKIPDKPDKHGYLIAQEHELPELREKWAKEVEIHQQKNEQLANAVSFSIMEVYSVARCSRCNDITYRVLQFNSSYTGMEIECRTCSKRAWLKPDEPMIEEIRDAYEAYYDLSWGLEPSDYIVVHASSISEQSSTTRHSIPKKIKQEIWRRDGGKCVECGSKENLEYDHIIPISKGGANTARNIQLLCEKCNRKKSSKIE